MTKFNPWQTASEVIGNRYCLTPKSVKRVLFKLSGRPNEAFNKAVYMIETNSEKFLDMILED